MAGKQPPSLDGLIQAKGAPRPSDVPQRGEASSPAAAPPAKTETVSVSPPRPVSDAEPRTKSLTLRLSEPRYQRLRRFAFNRDASHQEVIEAALTAYLDREGG